MHQWLCQASRFGVWNNERIVLYVELWVVWAYRCEGGAHSTRKGSPNISRRLSRSLAVTVGNRRAATMPPCPRGDHSALAVITPLEVAGRW